MTKLEDRVREISESFPFGQAGAVKRGRTTEWPYVALIDNYLGREGCTHNPMGRRAYATREEAIEAASRYLNMLRVKLRTDLLDPRMRALREQHGLPREIA